LPDKSGIYPAMSTVEGRTPPKDWIDALCLFDVDTKPGKIAWQHTTGFYDGAITHWLDWNTRAPDPEPEEDREIFLRQAKIAETVCDALWGGSHGWERIETKAEFEDYLLAIRRRMRIQSSAEALADAAEKIALQMNTARNMHQLNKEYLEPLAELNAVLDTFRNSRGEK